MYFSEALHDTDEGFDVVLPGSGAWDELSLLLIRGSEETWSACADAEGELVHVEPFAWCIATWSPGVEP